MRKMLISTILATGAMATSAVALDVETNGYARFALMGDTINGNEGFQSQKDWEFEFKGKEEFDNGITAFIDLEVDANSGADEIRTDDVTFGLSGSFGAVTMGNFNNGKVKAGLGLVPVMGSAYGFGSLEAGDNQSLLGLWTNGVTSIAHFSDVPTIAYTSPKISGFTAGASYSMSDGDGQTGTLTAEDTRTNTTSVGAQYGGKFGDASVTVGAAYTNMADQTAAATGDDTSFALGAKIGFSGITVGAAFKSGERNNVDYDLTTLGAQYSTGPFSLSAQYSVGDDLGDDYTAFDLGASYKVGPSAKVIAGITSGENDGVRSGESDSLYGVGLQINF